MPPLPSTVLILATAAAAFLAARALLPDATRRHVEARLGIRREPPVRATPLVEATRPLLRALAPVVRGFGLRRYREAVERGFVAAGLAGAMSTDEFLAYKVVVAVASWILLVGLPCGLLIRGSVPPAVHLLVPGVGLLVPDLWLAGEVRRRREAIRRALPDVLDLLTLSVEAGLDFVAGLHKVCEKSRSGPLVDEFALVLREIRVGASRQQALRALARRCAMPEISSFVALLVQADVLGASIGPVLRAQADLVRTRRHQQAERAGAHASQKILFPLVLCIMPAVFVVVFGPIVLHFVYGSGWIGG